MAVRQILALRKAGVEEIVLNVAHLGDRIVETLGDGSAWGVRLRYSVEGPHGGRSPSRRSAESRRRFRCSMTATAHSSSSRVTS